MKNPVLQSLSRRAFLGSTAMTAIGLGTASFARDYPGGALSSELETSPFPQPIAPGDWHFFTPHEARTVEAIVERLIPSDDLSIGGKDAGCATFIDRQLAGSFGSATRLYMRPPFLKGLPTQGDQFEATPAERYRLGIRGLDKSCRETFQGRAFADLDPQRQDEVLRRMEAGDLALEGPVPSSVLFALLLKNTMQGFFADPIYGGNRDMVSWRMLGFPGTRYDYRDHVARHNEPYTLPPVSIGGRPEWKKG